MTISNTKVVIGKHQILREIKANNIVSVQIATDCDLQYIHSIETVALANGVPVRKFGTKTEIATKYGIDVPSGAVGVLKEN